MSNPNKPYLVDAIIGNSKFLASLGSNGRMYRLWWPHIDFPQHVDAIRTGVRVADASAKVSWFDSAEEGWSHEAAYVEKTNIFRVQASNEAQSLRVDSYHYAVPEQSFIVRDYKFENTSDQPVSFEFVLHSSFKLSENELYNTTTFNVADDALIHFRRRYFFALSSANVCTKFQAGRAWDAAQNADLNGNVIDMQPDGALVWRIDELAAGQSVSIPVYIAAGENEEESLQAMRIAKSKPSLAWQADTDAYWRNYLLAAAPCPINRSDVAELYDRSLLVFKLMSDEQTGSIIAAPEFDEQFIRCGGYSYCWGRDAAFITTALDKAGLNQLSDRFYDWALTAQAPDGSWQQRHYHDGSLAPSWGLQIDEGSSIIWGMWQHYLENKDSSFAAKVWPAVERGARFLISYLDPATGLPKPSIDLWEEREASHTYSSAAVYGGLTAAASFATVSGANELADEWLAAAERIAERIVSEHWNEERESFYRGLNITVDQQRYERETADGKQGEVSEFVKGYSKHKLRHDPIVDISLLGISVPFGVVAPEHEYMRKTAATIERELTVPGVGGIKRYEDDRYIGGNPWILTSLWLAHYKLQTGQIEGATQIIDWVLEHRTTTGLLPEQVDKVTGETAWVVPLTWSHAMYILAVGMLADAEKAQAATAGEAAV
ncbi:glycoside hydrolase family 15 protein [Paenibacillus sp. NEAU-GSW1]|uniref:glycoside hydrolase family 15 protein n=1 Tax=Paenibacillus sp. NEAU-GSW1 TaxID=2682486 RepID=UPI0012E19382|nr:glycoside hydrolase family 15 protein [Paenibacillus sp. NEAU-GSW1]MUT64553.1 glycoside hydrolase family 15 [Paenibacillus sp. NEAU-GSW1]